MLCTLDPEECIDQETYPSPPIRQSLGRTVNTAPHRSCHARSRNEPLQAVLRYTELMRERAQRSWAGPHKIWAGGHGQTAVSTAQGARPAHHR